MPRVLLLLALLGCRRAPPPPVPVAPSGPTAAAMSWYLQAVVAEERGDLARADRAWSWVAREDRRNPHAHAHHARYLARQRRWPESEAAWQKARSLDPSWWEPYAGLAALAARREEPDEERRLLAQAVARGADGATIERAIERHEEAGDHRTALATVEVWLARGGLSAEERRRRWFVAQRLGVADRALADLRSTVDPRLPASALMFVDEALSACDLAEALDWAREIGAVAEPTAHPLVGAALDVADRAGDLSLIERLTDLRPTPAPAPSTARPADWHHAALRVAGAPLLLRLADGWASVGEIERAWSVLAALADDPSLLTWIGAVVAIRGLKGRDFSEPPTADAPRGAARIAWSLDFVHGRASAEVLTIAARALGPPDRLAEVLGSVAPPTVTARVSLGEDSTIEVLPPATPGGLPHLRLPAAAHDVWRNARDARLLTDADPSPEAVASWVLRAPDDPRAWVAMARVDPERAILHLDRALALDPCDADALAARARLAADADRAAWERRVLRADPLRPR